MPARSGTSRGGVGLNGWRPLTTGDGSTTLVHPVHGEACHSRAGAWEESRERYARACGLSEFSGGTLRLLDVGTGLGLNLAAALEAIDRPLGSPVRSMTADLLAVSLEKDEGVLRAALALAPAAPEVGRWHAPVLEAIARALDGAGEVPLGPRGWLRLVLGDARETLPALERELAFDAVFLDPFSRRVEPELWQPEFLAEVARRMAPGSRLSTYSASMSVRAALTAAGLRVGPGARIGTKSAGTLASPDLDLGSFDERTRRRIARRAAELSRATG